MVCSPPTPSTSANVDSACRDCHGLCRAGRKCSLHGHQSTHSMSPAPTKSATTPPRLLLLFELGNCAQRSPPPSLATFTHLYTKPLFRARIHIRSVEPWEFTPFASDKDHVVHLLRSSRKNIHSASLLSSTFPLPYIRSVPYLFHILSSSISSHYTSLFLCAPTFGETCEAVSSLAVAVVGTLMISSPFVPPTAAYDPSSCASYLDECEG